MLNRIQIRLDAIKCNVQELKRQPRITISFDYPYHGFPTNLHPLGGPRSTIYSDQKCSHKIHK